MKLAKLIYGKRGQAGWVVGIINTSMAIFGIVLTVIGVKKGKTKLRNFGFIWTAIMAIETGRIGKLALDVQEDTVFEPLREMLFENEETEE